MRVNYFSDSNEFFSVQPFTYLQIDDDLYLITTYTGNYITLDKDEFTKFRILNLDEDLFRKLEMAGIIITKNNFSRLVRNIYFQVISGRFCRFFVYSITRRCTNACIYCHANSPLYSPDKSELDMDEDTIKYMLEFISTFPYKRGTHITLVTEGGEPLLAFDKLQFLYEYKKIIEDRNGIKIRLDVVTNLVPMDEDIARTLYSWYKNGDFYICSSLDGPKELHDKQRPTKNGKGTYDTVTYWIEYFKKEFNIHIPLMPVVTKYTLEYSPRELLEEYYKWGQRVFFYKIFRVTGLGLKKHRDLYVPPEVAAKYWIDLIEETIKMYKENKPIAERITNVLVANIETPLRLSMCHRRPCGSGFDILTIDERGYIIGCDALRSLSHKHILGHVKIDDFYSIFHKSLGYYFYEGISDSFPLCSSCPFNAYCNICLTQTYGQHCNTWHPEPGNYDCKIYKEIFKYLFYLKYKEPEKWRVLREYSRNYFSMRKKWPLY